MNCYLFQSFKLCIRELYRIIHLTKTGIQLKTDPEKNNQSGLTAHETQESLNNMSNQ